MSDETFWKWVAVLRRIEQCGLWFCIGSLPILLLAGIVPSLMLQIWAVAVLGVCGLSLLRKWLVRRRRER